MFQISCFNYCICCALSFFINKFSQLGFGNRILILNGIKGTGWFRNTRLQSLNSKPTFPSVIPRIAIMYFDIIRDMIKQVLFDGKVEVGISEISDGNMRFFGDGNENEIIENQKKLGKALDLSGDKIARIRTIYSDRKNFTDYHEITDKNLLEYAIVNSEKQIPVSDGLTTICSNIGILLPLADCLGIVVFDKEHQATGLLHSGRQNVEQYGPKFIFHHMLLIIKYIKLIINF